MTTSPTDKNISKKASEIISPTKEDTLVYVAELLVELEKMTKGAGFPMVSFLLSMAAREASHEIFDKGLFITTTRQ
ncbi:MAG: hypothetical protein ABJO09_10445 [Hyphomicrobiales bacterium]